MHTKITRYLLMAVVGLWWIVEGCTFQEVKTTHETGEDTIAVVIPPRVLQRAIDRGYLIACTDYNSINYFVYRGRPMGYQLELLQQFCAYAGLGLEMRLENDLERAFGLVEEGVVDVLAFDLTLTQKRRERLDFCEPHGQTRQVLVQRRPENWRDYKSWREMEETMVRTPLDLARKTVHVQAGSSFYQRLQSLMDEIGDSIFVVAEPGREMEELITAVADGTIDYTVADEHVALVNQKYYPLLDVETPVSFAQNVAWAVKPGADSLRLLVNSWWDGYKESFKARNIYNRYFVYPRVYYSRNEFHSLHGDLISAYDGILREESARIGWDWRLLASLVYQESAFNPEAVSWVGAFGLMQLMPETAALFGVDSLSTPVEQIRAGVNLLASLDDRFLEEIPAFEERIKFILASYNVGFAHVEDARRLAVKYHKNPDLWTDNVDYYVLNKSKPKYYLDTVVEYGYCRGSEPYNFVLEILERYNHYKNVITP